MVREATGARIQHLVRRNIKAEFGVAIRRRVVTKGVARGVNITRSERKAELCLEGKEAAKVS